MADQAIINIMTNAAKASLNTAFTDDVSDNSLDEEVVVTNYATMTDSECESYLQTFNSNPEKFQEEYEKCYDCRLIRVPRRSKDTGWFSAFSPSTKTLIETDGDNFISDIREVEEANEERETPFNLHLFVDTHGGSLATAETICKAMLLYPGRIRVFVSNKAMSAGTLIALCGHEIYLRSHASLGQIDPQIGSRWFWLPANSIEETNKKLNEFETPWIRDLIRGGVAPAQDANARVLDLINRIAEVREWSLSFRERLCSNLLSNFLTGGFGHDRPYDYFDLIKFWESDENYVESSTYHNPVLHSKWPKSAKALTRKASEPMKTASNSYFSAFGF